MTDPIRTLKLTLEYDGTAYHGWQVQPSAPTIQGTLEDRIQAILGEAHRIHGAGRTDAGVHARAQVAHFQTRHEIPAAELHRALNATLPRDIAVRSIEDVPPDFHARKRARAKLYAYHILNTPVRAVFWDRYAWHIIKPLDVDAMDRAARYVLGTHDFTSFCATGCDIQNRVRTLDRVDFVRDAREVFRIEVQGNGFLRQMVRILVGTLVDVGLGRTEPERVSAILDGRDRRLAGRTAPAKGLFLERVDYGA